MQTTQHGETVAFWRAQLTRAVAQGQLRAEIVYLFGALLEEQVAQRDQARTVDPAQTAAEADLLAQLTTTHDRPAPEAWLDELFQMMEADMAELHAYVGQLTNEPITTPVDAAELQEVLEHISQDVYRSASVRRPAQRLMHDAALLKAFADALTIALAHLDEWDWPEDGVRVQARWTRTKWRLFTEEGLPDAALLEVLGMRWQSVLETVLGRTFSKRQRRLARLLELEAPEVIVDNERRMLKNPAGLHLMLDANIWLNRDDAQARAADQRHFYGEGRSIYTQRAEMQDHLRDFDHFAAYGSGRDGDAPGGMASALLLVNAEMRLARAAFPDHPLFVAKCDLRDYYASLDHAVLLTILARLGVGERDLAFFRRWLHVPVRTREGVVRVQRGIFSHRLLSDMLGELVMRLLDQYILHAANVEIVRLVDDICLITPTAADCAAAWRTLTASCTALGLAMHPDKCGAVAVGGALPPDLPTAMPRWSLLEVDADGHWHVHEPSFERYLEIARERIGRANSILAQVGQYNAHVSYLENALALRLDLGQTHQAEVRQALTRFHQSALGDGGDVVAALRQALHARFQRTGEATSIPEAWFYWPITAGGLGVRDALLLDALAIEGAARRSTPAIPRERTGDWLAKNNDWATLYAAWLAPITLPEPQSDQVMETLVRDFIQRGSEMANRQQRSLSLYWRWVLYTYGPQIREHFGSFRFLLTELVPLHIIVERRFGEEDEG